MDKVVKLKPAVKPYIWGGTYFKQFGKGDGEELLSELWELSVRDDENSLVLTGKDKNKLLKDIINKDDLGPTAEKFPYFPLLIKLIDAKDNLSVQVHPSDEYALKNEHSFGKTEMWYILGADEGSGLYVGLNKDYSKDEIQQKLNDGSIMDALNFFPVKPGDAFLIEAGTIHAIGKGVRLIEIQQNSNLTYRLYDYKRKDKFGNERELHIDKALKVINFKQYKQPVNNGEFIAKTPYFTVKRIDFDGELVVKADQGSFVSFTFIDGQGMVDDIPYQIYDTFFLPYEKECHIKGKGTIILSRV